MRPIKPDYLTDRLGANLDGMLAEYAVLNEEALVHVPSHLSFEEAAEGYRCLPCNSPRILGAQVIATTSTAEKADRLRALGASEVIDHTETPNWDEKVRELTNAGVDCVVEIGGPGTISMSLKALAVGGHLSLIGASLWKSGASLDPLLLTGRGITLGAINVGSRVDIEAMNRAIAMHRLRPVIDRAFPFAEARRHTAISKVGGIFGKVVITHG